MFRLKNVTVLTILLTFGFILAGCGGGDQQQQPAQEKEATEPAGTGDLVATVNFEGEAPEPETADASGNPECEVDTIKKQQVVVNDNGTLKNVVVAVKSGPQGLSMPGGEVKVNQNHCQYRPHVKTAKVGQTITIGDQDEGLHNVRGTTQQGRQLFNLQTFKGQSKEITIDQTGAISLQCDVHPWMQGWVYVTEHGAAAVTGQNGEASLNGLPTGEYTLQFWHEKYGAKTKSVNIEKDSESSVSVTFSA